MARNGKLRSSTLARDESPAGGADIGRRCAPDSIDTVL